MADLQNLKKEAFLFAEDLFSDIMSLHPMFRVYLPEYSVTPTKSSHFTRAVSKSVMVIWHELRNDLKLEFRRDFNRFSEGDAALKVYLEHLCGIVRKSTTCKIKQVIGFSAVLLELIAFLYERTYTDFLSNAPIYWLFMFNIIAIDEFYAVGGWKRLTALSKKLESDYDNNGNEIYWKYFDSMPRAQPDQGSESTRATSMQSPQKAASTSAKVGQTLPVEKGATSTVTSASGQNESEDDDATEPEDLNTSARGKTTKKGAPASKEKQTSAKKNRPKTPSPPKKRPPWRM